MQPETSTFKLAGSCRLHVDVHRPTTGDSQAAIVWLHGGALICGSRADVNPAQRDLYIKAGYAVIAPD